MQFSNKSFQFLKKLCNFFEKVVYFLGVITQWGGWGGGNTYFVIDFFQQIGNFFKNCVTLLKKFSNFFEKLHNFIKFFATVKNLKTYSSSAP